jgi:hypothetical protein
VWIDLIIAAWVCATMGATLEFLLAAIFAAARHDFSTPPTVRNATTPHGLLVGSQSRLPSSQEVSLREGHSAHITVHDWGATIVAIGFLICIIALLLRYDVQPEGNPQIVNFHQKQRRIVRDRWTGRTYLCSPSQWCKEIAR